MKNMNLSSLLINYIKKIKKRSKITFCFGIVFALLAHIFIMVNVINNYDSIFFTPKGFGVGVTSGRWALSLIGSFANSYGWQNYNIPFFNSLIAIVMLSFSAVIIVKIFDIQDLVYCILISGLFLSFPTVTSMMFFSFTVHYYAFAILLSIIACYLIKKNKFIISSFLMALSLGIYQAFFPLTVIIVLLLFIQKCIFDNTNIFKNIIVGIQYLLSLILGLVVYEIFLKWMLKIYNMQLTDYQGVNEMGISLNEIPKILKEVYSVFFKLILQDYCSINNSQMIKIIILIVYIIDVILTFIILRRKKILTAIEILFLCCLIPIGVNLIIVMCFHSNIYTLMVYSLVFIFIIPIILYEAANKCLNDNSVVIPKIELKLENKFLLISNWVIVIALGAVIINYIFNSNGNYLSLYYTNQQTVNYLNTLVTKIKTVEGYSDNLPVVYIGQEINDSSFDCSQWVDTPFIYGGNSTCLINRYSRNSFINFYLGYSPKLLEEEEIHQFEKDEEVQQMSCYPADGSIKVIDDVVVVKFSDVQ